MNHAFTYRCLAASLAIHMHTQLEMHLKKQFINTLTPPERHKRLPSDSHLLMTVPKLIADTG